MAVTRYDPWNVLSQFRDEMNRMLEESGTRLPAEADASSVVTSAWTPAVDIKENPDSYVLVADIPGVDPKNIDITMEGGVLTIRGERKHEETEEREGYRRRERIHGTFYRRFSLPDIADPDKISAKSKNGVLEVTIPKREQAQPRRITVS